MDTLLRAQYDRIHALCRRMAGNDADGDDATQEALLAVVRGLPTFQGSSKVSTWVYRVAVNACLDELRRRQRRPLPTELPEPAPTPSAESAVDQHLEVDAALALLPTDYRIAVVLRDLADLDYAEIARVLGIPLGTVRSRIARGRAALVPFLTSDGGNSPRADRRPTPEAMIPTTERNQP